VDARNSAEEGTRCSESVTPHPRNALTYWQAALYHEEVRPRLSVAAGTMLFAAGLLGCEDAGKKPMHARVPALAPAAAPQVPVELAPLPVLNPPRRYYVWLLPPVPSGKDYLIQKVQEKFSSGEQNFKAGHLEAARKDFDDAVDWMLESGYDPTGDPRLSELFHSVVDTVYAYELQAFRAGDGFSEAPAVPAAIDEVAEMTFPVDPRLKGRAEEAAKNISHDLPLTVNDQVLSFLNFFQTPRGPRHRGNRTAPRRALSRDDFPCAAGRRTAAGPHLPGASRERLPAAGAFARRRAGDLAIRGLPWAGIRASAHLVDR